MKSLEVSEEKANQRVEEFKRQLKSLTGKLKEAENRAELAEKTVKKLQKEVDRLEGRFIGSDPKLFLFLPSFIFFLKNYFETTKKQQKKTLRNFSVSNEILCFEIQTEMIKQRSFVRQLFAWL